MDDKDAVYLLQELLKIIKEYQMAEDKSQVRETSIRKHKIWAGCIIICILIIALFIVPSGIKIENTSSSQATVKNK